MSDPRKGLPSCSNLGRYMFCPGSWQAEHQLPDLPPELENNPIAQSGTKTHEVIECMIDGNATEVALSDMEQFVADRCVSIRNALVAEVFKGKQQQLNRISKTRFWMTHQGQEILSGEPDEMLSDGEQTLIIDYKRGMRPVPKASLNWQIHGYFFCATDSKEIIDAPKKWGMNKMRGAIIQPLASSTSIMATTPDQMVYLKRQAAYQLKAIRTGDQPRYPGEHCTYCPARHACVEAQALTPVLKRQFTSVRSLSDDQLLAIRQRIDLAKKMIEAYDAYFKERVVAGAIPGWETYEHGSGYEADYQALFNLVRNVIPMERYKEAISVSVASVREVYKQLYSDQHQVTKEEAAQVWDDSVKPHLTAKLPQIRVRESKAL